MKQITLSLLIAAALILTGSCQNKTEKRAEKTVEKIIEQNMDGDADVKIDDGNVEIKLPDGTSYKAESGAKNWPKEIPSDVPEFKFGKIEHVLKQDVGVADTWTVIYSDTPDDAVKKYEALLKKNGYDIMVTTNLSASGSVTAQKGETVIRAATNENGEATLSVTTKK